ncbi:Hypothetical predicted protein, partial [Paramuricea clavata]
DHVTTSEIGGAPSGQASDITKTHRSKTYFSDLKKEIYAQKIRSLFPDKPKLRDTGSSRVNGKSKKKKKKRRDENEGCCFLFFLNILKQSYSGSPWTIYVETGEDCSSGEESKSESEDDEAEDGNDVNKHAMANKCFDKTTKKSG